MSACCRSTIPCRKNCVDGIMLFDIPFKTNSPPENSTSQWSWMERWSSLHNTKQRLVGSDPALAFALFAFLINSDSGTRRVFHHGKTGAHTFRAFSLCWIDDWLFHAQPTIPFISRNMAFTSESRSGFLRGP
jgi:hypothetical protein